MEPANQVAARPRVHGHVQSYTKRVHRKVTLDLYELEPESGEDERINLQLELDQIEN